MFIDSHGSRFPNIEMIVLSNTIATRDSMIIAIKIKVYKREIRISAMKNFLFGIL